MIRPFYIDIADLEAFHYFYFVMGIFSFVSSLFLFVWLPVYSFFLILGYILHSIICWYVAIFIRKRLKTLLIISSVKYILGYLVITFLTVFGTLYFWSLSLEFVESLVNSIIFIDYFIFFVGIIWIFLASTRSVDKYFVESKTKRWQLVVKPVELREVKELERAKAANIIKEAEAKVKDLRNMGKDTAKIEEELDIAKDELVIKNYVNAYVFGVVAKKMAENLSKV